MFLNQIFSKTKTALFWRKYIFISSSISKTHPTAPSLAHTTHSISHIFSSLRHPSPSPPPLYHSSPFTISTVTPSSTFVVSYLLSLSNLLPEIFIKRRNLCLRRKIFIKNEGFFVLVDEEQMFVFEDEEMFYIIYWKTKRKAQSILFISDTSARLCLCRFGCGGGGRAETSSVRGRVGSFPTLSNSRKGGRAVSNSKIL